MDGRPARPEGEKKRREGKDRRGKTEKRSTGPSRVVPHRSTTPARTCLTSLFGWEAVSQADMAAMFVQSDFTKSTGVLWSDPGAVSKKIAILSFSLLRSGKETRSPAAARGGPTCKLHVGCAHKGPRTREAGLELCV